MARIGDKVALTISNAALGGLKIGKGGSMSVTGEIIQDLEDNWLVLSTTLEN